MEMILREIQLINLCRILLSVTIFIVVKVTQASAKHIGPSLVPKLLDKQRNGVRFIIRKRCNKDFLKLID